MTTNDVKLLGAWPSPFALRVRIALNIKSVNYEFVEETMMPKSQLLLQSNPVHKKIPVLIHGDKPNCESLIIVQYIDELWSSGHSILPSDPYDRAIAHFWATYLDDKLFPSLRGIPRAKTDEEKKTSIEQVIEELGLLEEAFRKLRKGKAYFGGDQIGYLDVCLGCFVGWLWVTEKMNGLQLLNEEKTPGLLVWAEKFCSNVAVKDVMPETDDLLVFAKFLFAKSETPFY